MFRYRPYSRLHEPKKYQHLLFNSFIGKRIPVHLFPSIFTEKKRWHISVYSVADFLLNSIYLC
jgi:hypothetical protein